MSAVNITMMMMMMMNIEGANKPHADNDDDDNDDESDTLMMETSSVNPDPSTFCNRPWSLLQSATRYLYLCNLCNSIMLTQY